MKNKIAEQIFKELKEMPRYKQTNGRLGFMFTYEDYLKLRRKFAKSRDGEKNGN